MLFIRFVNLEFIRFVRKIIILRDMYKITFYNYKSSVWNIIHDAV